MQSTRRGSLSVHRSEKTPGSKYSSTSGLSPRGHLEWQAEFHASTQDEAGSEEHTSELQSPTNLVCRLLLEKKKKNSSSCNSIKASKRSKKDVPPAQES